MAGWGPCMNQMNDVKVLDALLVQETDVNLICNYWFNQVVFFGGYFIPRTGPVTYGMGDPISWSWKTRTSPDDLTVLLSSLKQTAKALNIGQHPKGKRKPNPKLHPFFRRWKDMLVWGSVFTFGDLGDPWRNRCVRFLHYRWYRCCSFKVFAVYRDLIGKWPNLNQFDILYQRGWGSTPRTRKVSG